MSTQETEFSDCQERVGLKRKLTGPPRLLLGKSNKSKEKADSQRRQRRDKCCEDMSDNISKQQELSHITHNSPQKTPELEEPEPDAQGDTSGILVTLEENQGKEENLDNKAGMTRSTSKTAIKRTLSSLLCSGRGRKESDCDGHAEDRTENRSPQESNKNKNKAPKETNSPYENKQCDGNNKTISREKGKRNFFFMLWPISKKSSNISEGRQSREQCGSVVLQETQPKAPFKKMYRMFPRRKKAQPPIDQHECDVSTTAHNEVAGDQRSTANMEIPSTHKQEHQEKEQKNEESTPETLTISAEVSINTNIESGHIDDESDICPDPNVGQIKNEDKHPEPTNDILQTSELLDSSCSFDCAQPDRSIGDVLELNDVNQEECGKNDFKCKPVITIERVYTPEEENQEDNVNQSRFDFLSMNGSWQHLKINHFTNNTLHPSDPSVSPEPDHSRCNETLLIQTAISMVQAAIRGAVEQFANEQQHNQISLDRA
ncbi:uncharacterized protein [Paramisgurnus dabryanus]|uniref:uncharacterized protein n=1 Tax=Paramisgurnus dabryanus TaxID=90735 RepID=UPI0031F3D1C2